MQVLKNQQERAATRLRGQVLNQEDQRAFFLPLGRPIELGNVCVGRNTEQRREQRQGIPSQRMLLDKRLKPEALGIGGLIGF